MLAEFVKSLVDLADKASLVELKTIQGKGLFSSKALIPVREHEILLPKVVNIHTLTGLVEYLRENRDKLPLPELMVHVQSPIQVRLVHKLQGEHNQRAVYVETSFEPLSAAGGGHSFQFGTFHHVETFLIGLLSQFSHTPDRDNLVKIVGNIQGNQVAHATDDGVTQQVTLRAGVSRLGNEIVSPIQNLAPWRTFREVEQPMSAFLLRMRQGEEKELPKVALFEADGGQWRLDAINSIARFLKAELASTGVAVLA